MTRSMYKVCIAISLPLFVVWVLWECCDFSYKRHWYATHVKKLVAASHANPANTLPVQKIVVIANGRYRFGAVYAIASLRELPESRDIIIPELVTLLDSPERVRAREAAIGLEKLRVSAPEHIDAIARKVESSEPGGDVTFFCIDALAAAGAPAVRTLPMLRSKIGTGSQLFEESLQRAIRVLEKHDP